MRSSPGVVGHLLVAAAFVGLMITWTYPLAFHLTADLPGAALGDNAAFLWNVWWMRTALAQHTSYFHTTYLFAPIGTNLTLNTHSAAAAFAAATLLRSMSPIAALNVTTLVSLVLNAFCAYLLAWRVTGDRTASFVAGLIFGTSPYIAAHLNGHFNLTTAWTIPLFALAFVRGSASARSGREAARQAVLAGQTAQRSAPADKAAPRSMWPSLAAGAILGFTVYVDYYYVIYECVLAICLVLVTRWRWTIHRNPPRAKALLAVGVVAAIDLVLIAAIADNFNLRQAFGILAMIGAWLYFSPRISAERRPAARAFARASVTIGVAAVVAAPLAWHAWELVRDGDYVTQTYFWRSAPTGIDLATLVLGNPFHGVWGSTVSATYATLGIDRIESAAWLGIVAPALAAYALIERRTDAAARAWTLIAAVFLVWSLGSHVHIAGRNLGFITPAAFLQFVPIVSNARMPGRAMVVVDLAVAMLAAIGVAELRTRGARAGLIAAILATIALDFWIAPFPTTRVACPTVYTTLRDRPEAGTVAELPVVLADGLGSLTPVSDRTALACQMIHQRPIAGGFVARLSPRVLTRYETDPLLATWMQLSGARIDPPALSAGDVGAWLRADGIAFILLNRATASDALRDHVEHHLPVTLIAEEGDRVLYAVR